MNKDFLNILSNSSKDINNQQLMDYLSNHINKADEHEVEKAMTDNEFVNDAVEGLQQIRDKRNINTYVEQLHDELHRQIAKNKKRKEKRRLKDSPYIYLTITVLLVLIIICFVVVKKYVDQKKHDQKNKSSVTLIQTQKNKSI